MATKNFFIQAGMLGLIMVSLTACGGDSGENSSLKDYPRDETIISNKFIDSLDIPIHTDGIEMEGVSANLIDGVIVYALTEKNNANSLKIISSPNATDGDKSTLLGKTFLKFDGLKGLNDLAVISGGKVKSVYECDSLKSECKIMPVNWDNNSKVSFEINQNKFYAIESE